MRQPMASMAPEIVVPSGAGPARRGLAGSRSREATLAVVQPHGGATHERAAGAHDSSPGPVALDVRFEEDGVGDDALDGCGGGRRGLEDPVPPREDEVACDEDRALFSALGREGEEDRPAVADEFLPERAESGGLSGSYPSPPATAEGRVSLDHPHRAVFPVIPDRVSATYSGLPLPRSFMRTLARLAPTNSPSSG